MIVSSIRNVLFQKEKRENAIGCLFLEKKERKNREAKTNKIHKKRFLKRFHCLLFSSNENFILKKFFLKKN